MEVRSLSQATRWGSGLSGTRVLRPACMAGLHVPPGPCHLQSGGFSSLLTASPGPNSFGKVLPSFWDLVRV